MIPKPFGRPMTGRHGSGVSGPAIGMLLTLAAVCGAQQPGLVYPLPAPSAFTVRADIGYHASSGSLLRFDLFRPSRAASGERLPVLVIFNGYGGSIMRVAPQSVDWAKAATAHGLAAIAVETTPGHAGPDFDSLTALLTRD